MPEAVEKRLKVMFSTDCVFRHERRSAGSQNDVSLSEGRGREDPRPCYLLS
jgi:hypothetical protein